MSIPPGPVPALEPLEAPQTIEERKQRQRLHVKRTYYKKLNKMQSLRDNLHELEREFERLMARKQANHQSQLEALGHTSQDIPDIDAGGLQPLQAVTTQAIATDPSDDHGMRATQALLTEILAVKERLRAENDALQRAIADRERFSIKIAAWMHVDDLGTSSSDDDPIVRAQDPSTMRLAAPVSVDTCLEIALQTYAEMQLFSQSHGFLSTGVSVFGWRDKRIRVDDRVKFSMQKIYEGITALELSLRGWATTGASNRLAQLYSASMNVNVTTLQRVDDDNEIKLRVMASENGKKRVKTLFLVSRFAIPDGTVCIIRSIDPQTYLAPYADPLGVEEQWVESYNWTSFHEEGDHKQHCKLVFGGEVQSNAVAGSDMWMIEVLLVALRWENLVVRPIFTIC